MNQTHDARRPCPAKVGRGSQAAFNTTPLLAAMVLAWPMAPALAQTTDAPDATPRVGKLETVTVTAERRVENIKNVPMAISTLAGEKLDVLNSGGQDIRFLSARVPSLNIESSFGRAFPRFYVRGLGNSDFDLNASQPVSLILDDIVQENPILKGFPLFDIERIEVLRGPQGTMFGRNTPAGALKFESVKPGKKLEGYVNASYGTHATTNVEGAINVPLNAEWATRVSIQSQNRNDWVTNTFAAGPTKSLEGYHDTAVRVQLAYKPGANFDALLNVHGRDLDGSARLFRANIIKPGTNELVDGFDPAKISTDGKNEQTLSSSGASLRLRWDLGGVSLHSITGYESVKAFSRGDIDGGFGASFLPSSGPGFIPFDAESADGLPRHRQFTQELRLESNDKGPLKWIGGAYLFDESIDVDSFNYSSIGGNTQNGYATQKQDNRAYAIFGSLNVDVSDALKVRGGLRYTRDKKDFVADRITAPPFSPPFIGRLSTATSASNVSGDFSGTYSISKATNFYGRLATGFRAPSIQGRLLFGDALSVANSEKITSIEGGMKSDLLDGRARVSLGLFQYTMKNQQLTAVGGAANFNQLINADKVTGRGAEVDLQAFVTDNLLMTLGGSLNKTRIRDANLRVDACGSGCTVLNTITAAANPAVGKFSPTVSIDGNPLPQAPEVVVNFTARYGMPHGNGGEWFVYTDWAYRSKVNFFLYKATEFTGKALLEGGLRIGYTWGSGKYEAALFGRNITNQIQTVGGIDFNNLTGMINEPRTWGLQLKAAF